MTSVARNRILNRLYAHADAEPTSEVECRPVEAVDRDQRVHRLTDLMTAMRTDVHRVAADNWTEHLRTLLKAERPNRLLYAPESDVGPPLEAAWQRDSRDLPPLTAWPGDIEEFKDALFGLDAAITTTAGAIAESGAIVLWPDANEPRLMSLVPPVHIAVLDANRIYGSFCDIIEAQQWPRRMPTNALLISGPSKTADIEMTLAFGVHGPRKLIVFIVEE